MDSSNNHIAIPLLGQVHKDYTISHMQNRLLKWAINRHEEWNHPPSLQIGSYTYWSMSSYLIPFITMKQIVSCT